ncbi:MAG: YitT family protein [Sulfobacillus sp.]
MESALGMVLGAVIGAVGLNFFLIPNHLIDGGLTGIAILLYDVFHLPVGPMLLLLNLPLVALSWVAIGPKFVVRTVIGTVLFSLALTVLPIHPVVHDQLLAAVYGGLLSGAGVGLIFRMGGSTGGTDFLARLLRRYLDLPLGVGLLGADALVIALFAVVMGLQPAMYSLLALFVGSRIIDFLIDGLAVQRVALVVSVHPDQIAEAVMAELGRGVTALQGQGMYSKEERPVLLIAVSRLETVRLKSLVVGIDPRAFLIIHHAHEVLGEGFMPFEPGLRRRSQATDQEVSGPRTPPGP